MSNFQITDHVQYKSPVIQHDLGRDEAGRLVPTLTVDFSAYCDDRAGVDDRSPEEQAHDQRFRDAGDMLEALVLWFAGSPNVRAAGTKALTLAWVLRPRAFRARTMGELATRFDVTKQCFSKHASEIFRLSRGVFQNVGMGGAAARAKRRRITIDYHKAVGHRIGRRKQP